jgi:hypothetical protein
MEYKIHEKQNSKRRNKSKITFPKKSLLQLIVLFSSHVPNSSLRTLAQFNYACFFIDFGLEKNKKNIWKLQNLKWPLNSRWQPKFDLLLKSLNRLFYQIFFYLTFIEYFFSQKYMAPIFNMYIFLASFSRSSHIRQEF